MNLDRFARVMYRRRRSVVGFWILALVLLTAAAGRWGGDHRTDYRVPGSDSAAAFDRLTTDLPELSGDQIQLVVHSDNGVTSAEATARINELTRRVALVKHVVWMQPAFVAPDGRTALVVAQLDDTAEKVPKGAIEEIIEITRETRSEGFQVEAGGTAIQMTEAAEPGSEQFGMIAALLILLIAFGSLLAAGVPIVVAIFGVGTGLAISSFINHLLVVPDWAPQLVTMIGIGVGIDYALFVVVRYRSALRDGLEPEDAVAQALSTAGRAVVVAACTVMISLLGLCAMGLNYLYGVAVVTSVGVLVVLVAAMTLLPAVLGFAGRNIDRLRLPFFGKETGSQSLWHRWSRIVQRSPLATGAVSLIVLLALAIPFTDLRFGNPDSGSTSTDFTSRRAYDLVSQAYGPGSNGPLLVTVDTSADDALAGRVAERIRHEPGVAAVLDPVVSRTGPTTALFVIPASGPQDKATETLVHSLRNHARTELASSDAERIHIGGATATFIDDSTRTGHRLPLFIGAVIALSFVLLLVVFRSPLVALKAATMNLLAIGAAYGVMAVALRGGWLGQLIGIDEPTPIPAWAPMMMFALLFGLSMDYEVFLLSRIREEYRRTHDNATAVADGLAFTGRVISAAAAIMVTVFAAFILGDDVLIKVIGLGLAVAVALDATLVRMVLVPSTMELLGDRNWWIPRWLDRILPNIEIERSHGGNADRHRRTVPSNPTSNPQIAIPRRALTTES